MRLTWSSPGLAQPSTLQVTLVAAGDKTSFRFQQERLSSMEEREAMRSQRRHALEELERVALQQDFTHTDQ